MKKTSLFLVFVLFLTISCDIFNRKADCVLVGEINLQQDSLGNVKFLGEIKNDGDGKALSVEITFTIKDSGESVIDVASAYVTSTDLDPGQTSSFECYSDAPYPDVSSYEYEISWSEPKGFF